MKKHILLNGNTIEVTHLSNKGVRLVFLDYTEPFNKRISLTCKNRECVLSLIQQFTCFLTEKVKKEEKAYTDEINTYKDEIERSLFITGKKGDLSIYLDCYTDKPYDDNWIDLTPKRLSKLVGLIYGYL